MKVIFLEAGSTSTCRCSFRDCQVRAQEGEAEKSLAKATKVFRKFYDWLHTKMDPHNYEEDAGKKAWSDFRSAARTSASVLSC